MKKMLALLLAMAMILSLAACGGDEGYEEPAEDEAYEEDADYEEDEEYAEDEDVEEYAEDEEDSFDSDAPVSDEHFADLQDSFAQLAELYDQVVELYSADEIAADESINENLSKTKDIMVTMAGISKENLTEGDALKLMESMGYLAQALGMIVDDMEAA